MSPRRLIQLSVLAVLFVVSGCSFPPEGTGMDEFEPGRWSDETGEVWIEFDAEPNVVEGVFPVELVRAKRVCEGGKSAGNEFFEATWHYVEGLDAVAVTVRDGEREFQFDVGPRLDGDWSVIEVDACGPDAWPPVWIVFQQSD